MKNNLDFTPIDITTWERGGHFWYFSQMAPTGYSLTVDIDVTNLKNTLKSNDISFYPAYLWLVTKALNEHKEFKISQKDGKIGYFASLCPLYAIFHQDNKTFSLMWTEYSDDFREFYKAYSANKEKYSQNKGILAQTDKTPPENAYTVSCLPWIDFKHFAVHSYENKPYYFPSVESGKFYEKDGKQLMPLSITCHHATTDGWHVKQFIERLQCDADEFHIFL